MQLEGEDRFFKVVPGRRLMPGTNSPEDRRGDLKSNYVNFKTKAIHHLNEVLRNSQPENVTSSTILAIIFLLRTEVSPNYEQTSETRNTDLCRLWTEVWKRCGRICPACNSYIQWVSTSTTIPQWSSPVSSGEQPLRCSTQRH